MACSESERAGGYVSPEAQLPFTIRWLSGGSYLDISDHYGVSKATFYRLVYECIDLIIDAFPISFPLSSGRRLTVLITAHGLEAKTDRGPSEDLAPRHALTRCSITLCDLVLRLPRLLPAPCFVQLFEKRLCSGRCPRPAVVHHPRKRKPDGNRGFLL